MERVDPQNGENFRIRRRAGASHLSSATSPLQGAGRRYWTAVPSNAFDVVICEQVLERPLQAREVFVDIRQEAELHE